MIGSQLLEMIDVVSAGAENELRVMLGHVRRRPPGDAQMEQALDECLVKLAILRRRVRMRGEKKARVAS